jgi:hypothetical protein
MDAAGFNDKPATVQGNLAKLPHALGPFVVRPQWCNWKWIRSAAGVWQKPPFQARDPRRYASSTRPETWTDYATALATVQAGLAEGVTYMLTADEPLAAIDIDHCRNRESEGIDDWAQALLAQAGAAYVEVTPSGSGLRVWGTAKGASLARNIRPLNVSKDAGIEFYRRPEATKPLTISGLQIGSCRKLSNIDASVDRVLAWAEQHKGAAIESNTGPGVSLRTYSIEEIERAVREGAPDDANRSNLFHAIVGHYWALGWKMDQIAAHLEQYPDGIADRYLCQARLQTEIGRSLDKWHKMKKAQQFATGSWTPTSEPLPEQEPPEVQDEEPPEVEPEAASAPALPPIFSHGDPDPRPLTSWLVKNLLASVSFGMLAGQWGSGKTFMVFELSACLMTGQPFIGHRVKRQCGVLYIPAEGVGEVRKRLTALVQEKCGGMQRAPFRWYEAAPTLLGPNAAETLIAMARQAEASLQQEFGLSLGLIVIDTVAASAGYAQQGAESDAAVAGHIMRVLAQVATTCSCVVLGVDHFGKNIETGTRGSSAKEANAELVLACLGEREVSGRVINTRLAIRKNRAGPQGMEYPFTLREVELGVDEDGDPITTMVVDWTNAGDSADPGPGTDSWAESRQANTRQAMLLLKRVMMAMLAEKGVDLPSAPDGPAIRMIDRELVRDEFYARTAADGTVEQKQDQRRKRFRRAVDRAEEKQLIGIREINGTVYLWLAQAQPEEDF